MTQSVKTSWIFHTASSGLLQKLSSPQLHKVCVISSTLSLIPLLCLSLMHYRNIVHCTLDIISPRVCGTNYASRWSTFESPTTTYKSLPQILQHGVPSLLRVPVLSVCSHSPGMETQCSSGGVHTVYAISRAGQSVPLCRVVDVRVWMGVCSERFAKAYTNSSYLLFSTMLVCRNRDKNLGQFDQKPNTGQVVMNVG